jgi:hypothetical protein
MHIIEEAGWDEYTRTFSFEILRLFESSETVSVVQGLRGSYRKMTYSESDGRLQLPETVRCPGHSMDCKALTEAGVSVPEFSRLRT